MPSKTHSKVRQNPIVKNAITYIIDLKDPIKDGVIEISDIKSHLEQSIKLNGKKGLGDSVKVDSKDTQILVSTNVVFSKRYIKYLTKRYLKKQDLRDFLRVVATSKNSYAIKFFNISEDAAENK